MDELHRSEALSVRASASAAERWVVTFDNYRHDFDLDREGFGAGFFASRGIAFVSVVGAGNDWYQYPDMAAALEAIRTRVASARAVMTYGSSMGGYAALRFADRVRATAVLALSPQYALPAARVPFEKRWRQEAASIAWRPELDLPLGLACVPTIVYDSRGTDRHHFDLIAAETAVAGIGLPFAGHPVATLLGSLGLLEPLISETLDNTLDAARFTDHARQLSHADPVYLSELAGRQPACRPLLKLALAERAVAIAPDAHVALHTLGLALTTAGRATDALPHYERLMILSDRYAGYAVPYADALLAAGYTDAARRIAEGVIEKLPHAANLRAWLARIQWRAGDRRAAYASISHAAKLDPHDDQIRQRRLRYKIGGLLPS